MTVQTITAIKGATVPLSWAIGPDDGTTPPTVHLLAMRRYNRAGVSGPTITLIATPRAATSTVTAGFDTVIDTSTLSTGKYLIDGLLVVGSGYEEIAPVILDIIAGAASP